MGKNKLQKFADMNRYPNVFQRTFADLQNGAFEMRGRWNEVFFNNDRWLPLLVFPILLTKNLCPN